MAEQSVMEEQRGRVATDVNLLADIAAVQAHGQHVFVAGCMSALARLRVADLIDGETRVGEVATREGVKELALRRILRFLEPHGYVGLENDRPTQTGKGRLLRSDSPCGRASPCAAPTTQPLASPTHCASARRRSPRRSAATSALPRRPPRPAQPASA